jgi:hypothetical protein
MARITRLLVVANAGVDSEEVLDAIVTRAAEGAVHITLVAPAAVGAGPLSARRGATAEELERASRAATEERLQRAVRQLRAAGVSVDGVMAGELDVSGGGRGVWDPPGFDEVVVSCRPWLSFTRAVFENGSAGPPSAEPPGAAG